MVFVFPCTGPWQGGIHPRSSISLIISPTSFIFLISPISPISDPPYPYISYILHIPDIPYNACGPETPSPWRGEGQPLQLHLGLSLYQYFIIGTTIRLYGLKLSLSILTQRDAFNGSIPKGSRTSSCVKCNPRSFGCFLMFVPETEFKIQKVLVLWGTGVKAFGESGFCKPREYVHGLPGTRPEATRSPRTS